MKFVWEIRPRRALQLNQPKNPLMKILQSKRLMQRQFAMGEWFPGCYDIGKELSTELDFGCAEIASVLNKLACAIQCNNERFAERRASENFSPQALRILFSRDVFVTAATESYTAVRFTAAVNVAEKVLCVSLPGTLAMSMS